MTLTFYMNSVINYEFARKKSAQIMEKCTFVIIQEKKNLIKASRLKGIDHF